MDEPTRHLALLTRTIEVVNSSLDLREVMESIAHEVASALQTDACFVYLYDDATSELVLHATHGTAVESETARPRMRPGEGITGVAAAERNPVMIPSKAHLDPRFKGFPNLREDEYESILAVPILASRPREKLEGALNVRTREPRAFTDGEISLLVAIASQVAQSIEHARLYEAAQSRVRELEALARVSEAVSESLYVEQTLESIVRTTVESVAATGAAIVLEDGRVAWPEGRAGEHAVRLPLRSRGRVVGQLVVDRDTPLGSDDLRLLEAVAGQAALALEQGRMALRGVLAQEIHHRVKNNLQTVAALLRLQQAADDVDPRKALGDSVSRILAIAAVHEELTEHQEDVVDLGELVDRLRAMLIQGVGVDPDRRVVARLEDVTLAGQRATALALVLCELLGNAMEHGRGDVSIDLRRHEGEIVLAVADQGPGMSGADDGTGLSIVRALVRDELGGSLQLVDGRGLKAIVTFPV
jgi:two-component system, sensor histidine kinase PdtaS